MKWEYFVADVPSENITSFMNIWGADDWELVSVDNGTAYFKRVSREYLRQLEYKQRKARVRKVNA